MVMVKGMKLMVMPLQPKIQQCMVMVASLVMGLIEPGAFMIELLSHIALARLHKLRWNKCLHTVYPSRRIDVLAIDIESSL